MSQGANQKQPQLTPRKAPRRIPDTSNAIEAPNPAAPNRRSLMKRTIILNAIALFFRAELRAENRHILVDLSHHESTFSNPFDNSLAGHAWGPAMAVLEDAEFSWSATCDSRVSGECPVLTSDEFAGSCMLVVAEPLVPFASEEVSAILAWVEEGGGLLLANDFNLPINQLSQPTGVEFTLQAPYGFIVVDDVEDHPITEGVDRIDWPVGGTLTLAAGVAELVEIARLPQGESALAARTFGQGRIVYIADNEVFANFGINNEDNSRLLVNVAGWLCQSDRDGDGVANEDDNCPDDANADQADFDDDGLGDACDDDDDGDGTADASDGCGQSPPGEPVGTDGCTCGERLEAECPGEGDYRNHGDFVSCVAGVASECVDDGLVSEEEKGEIVSNAAGSDVGKKE